MKLYKFHSINENLLKSLQTKTNWYSRLKYLNDPFDLFFNDQTGMEVYKSFKETICVCSFSKNRNEVLMWSHYANNHEGLCLEFEIDEDALSGSIFEIKYSNEIDTLEQVERHASRHLALNIATNGKFMNRKFQTWAYEEEMRFMRINEDLNLNGVTASFPGELTAIYFGRNSSKENIDLILLNSKHFDNLKYYKVDIDINTAKMDVVQKI